MDSFGQELHVINRDNFEELLYLRNLRKLRKNIYFFILENKRESDFFDIDKFNRTYVNNISKTNDMINIIVKELNLLGWNTYIGFGGTGLYIYSTEEKPASAW